MGLYHGKLVIHMPSGSLGIASSRKNPSPKDECESWDYLLRRGDQTRTPFFPQREFRLATASQKSRFQEFRRSLAPRQPRPSWRRQSDAAPGSTTHDRGTV